MVAAPALAMAPHSGTHRLNPAAVDLVSATGGAVTAIQENLERARDVVRDAVGRLLASFGGLRAVVEQQQGLLVELSSSLQKSGAGNFTNVAGKLVNEFVDEIVRVSHRSMQILEQIEDTGTHLDAIGRRTQHIDGLAREIRFIALNARIETQRAGEAGRTFKVVADEVKRLSSASAALSTEIRADVAQCTRALAETRGTAVGLASHDMSTALESRDSLVATIESLDAVNGAVEVALAQVGKSVSDAVRALQFEDIVTQLLADSTNRIRKLSTLLLDAVSVAQERRPDAAARTAQITIELIELGRVGSVEQRSVDAGAVELF
jgi:methyl-accepting chemotaxis protein